MRRGLFDDNLISEFNNAKDNLVIPTNNFKLSFNNDEELLTDLDKILKSSKINILQRLDIITRNVYRILGKYKKSVQVIKTKKDLHDYISRAIQKGRIAIDTETNNSLDPVTCKLAGLCLYYPGAKQAYIPVNHRDPITKERLSWQLTEADITEELQRIVDAGTYVVMHNGKFDYEVIKCTCGIELPIDWDTMVGQRILDENDQAGLKYLYTRYLNPAQSKYSIDKLFVNVQYLDVDPEVFALYAATDSFETDEVFLWEVRKIFKLTHEIDDHGQPDETLVDPDMARPYKLFKTVEMPIVRITADMELAGVSVDQSLGARLKEKYDKQLLKMDEDINAKLSDLDELISSWRLTPEANAYPRQYQPKKSKKAREALEEEYPLVDQKTGKRYKISKTCLKDKLTTPINLASSAQMAILFYDILDITPFDKKAERTTGEEAIEKFKDILTNKAEEAKTWVGESEPTQLDLEIMAKNAKPFESAAKLCDLLLKRRGIVKLITTYIETIPTLVKHWPDGRIRFHLNSLGTDTGRYSSGGKLKFMEDEKAIEVSGINIQNIPSHVKEIRLLFKAECKEEEQEVIDNVLRIPEYIEVETPDGWKYPSDLQVNSIICTDEGNKVIQNITSQDKMYCIFI